MAMPAIWFQQTYTFSSGNSILLMVFIGVVAASMAVQAIVQMSISVKALKAIKGIAATAEDIKQRVLPLVETAAAVAKSTQALITETSPKVRVIADNLVDTSSVVRTSAHELRASAQQLEKTISDVNLRTQKQVAKVDGMVTAALNTTAEVAENIERGIRVPVQKIGMIATQAKYVLEGILAKVKSMAAKTPFFDSPE